MDTQLGLFDFSGPWPLIVLALVMFAGFAALYLLVRKAARDGARAGNGGDQDDQGDKGDKGDG